MSLTKAIDKILDVSNLIELRMSLKEAEKSRVLDAFALLAHGSPKADSKGLKQRVVYLEVLRKLEALLGMPEVAICAAALGPTSVAALKDRDRVKLPHEMKKVQARIRSDILVQLAKTCYTKCMFPPLAHSNCH